VLQPIVHPVGGHVPLSAWLHVAFLAALPGLVWMALVVLMLHRALKLSGMFSAGELAARAPNSQVLAEQRFGNVIQEMALAASLPSPRVLIVDAPEMNAAVFGGDEQHATVLVSQGLLAQLDRDQLQGIAAHLIGSIADGDMAIGMRAATTLSLFAFIARFAGIFGDESRGVDCCGSACRCCDPPRPMLAACSMSSLTRFAVRRKATRSRAQTRKCERGAIG
jgi:Zn-dependent protease with chaperone function